jgi:glycosyltransferase involved in cell wall biosynthesis
MKKILLINWVTVSRKQLYQLKAINDCGYTISVFTNDQLGDSEYWVNQAGTNSKYIKQPPKLLARIQNLLKALDNQESVKCAILAPEGRYSIIALILLKLMRVRIVCIEWGGIGYINKSAPLLRMAMYLCYKYSDLIWYKEPYMKPLLSNMTSKPLFFLPNAVEVASSESMPFSNRNISFLWANRLVQGRRPDWYICAANKIYNKSGQRAVLMGFLEEILDDKMQKRCKNLAANGVELLNFGNSYQLLPQSRFFVLAADQVFGNNSLLEAMSHGSVPIVTRSIGVDEIIEDGENGFIAENTEVGLYEAMKKASEIDELVWSRLSQNAIETVAIKFSVSNWKNEFFNMTAKLERGFDV